MHLPPAFRSAGTILKCWRSALATSDSPEIFRPLLLLLLEGEEEGVLVEDGGVDCLVHVGHLSLTPVIHRVFLAIKLSSLISFNYLYVIP